MLSKSPLVKSTFRHFYMKDFADLSFDYWKQDMGVYVGQVNCSPHQNIPYRFTKEKVRFSFKNILFYGEKWPDGKNNSFKYTE